MFTVSTEFFNSAESRRERERQNIRRLFAFKFDMKCNAKLFEIIIEFVRNKIK